MSRPFYETSQDREKEREAINAVVGNRFDICKLPTRYEIDFALFKDNQIKYWVEVKCRNVMSTRYETAMISSAKMIRGINLYQSTGAPFMVLFRWVDAIGTIRIDSLEGITVQWGGRYDRNDPQDAEPVCHIPIKLFKIKPFLRNVVD